MLWNLNHDDTNENFGVIEITLINIKNKQIQIKWIPNNKASWIVKKPLNWEHKGTQLGVPIRKKLHEFQTSELIFKNVQWSNYDSSQPDFLLSRIWKQLFNEILV